MTTLPAVVEALLSADQNHEPAAWAEFAGAYAGLILRTKSAVWLGPQAR